MLCEGGENAVDLGGPAATNLASEHDQACSLAIHKFWVVCLMFTARSGNGDPVMVLGA